MKIIWAVDAFENNYNLIEKMAQFTKALYVATNSQVEPVYLLLEDEILVPEPNGNSWEKDHTRTAESLFKEILSDFDLPFTMNAKVIAHTSRSPAGMAASLNHYALRSKADLIIIGCHARKGLSRALLGSVSESLLNISEIPVCIMNSGLTKSLVPKKILFPTEFGDHSLENFRHILSLAKQMNAEVVLIHALEKPMDSFMGISAHDRIFKLNGKMMNFEEITRARADKATLNARRWGEIASNQGVIYNFLIDNSFKKLEEVLLLAVGSHNIDLVAMEAQSGPVSNSILGSTTRQIFRSSSCPTYIIPRHFYDKSEDRFRETPAP